MVIKSSRCKGVHRSTTTKCIVNDLGTATEAAHVVPGGAVVKGAASRSPRMLKKSRQLILKVRDRIYYWFHN